FLAAAGPVGDGDLERADLPGEELAGDLRFHAEPLGGDVQAAVQLQGHQLEAGLQVGDIGVEQDVGDGRDALVAHDVPERVGRVAAQRPAAQDHHGPPAEHRLEEFRDLPPLVVPLGVARLAV